MNHDEGSRLIKKAQLGDASAEQQLLILHRDRLKRMIVAFLDRRISARIDPSDVLQDTLALAAKRLPSYLVEQPIEFYPWLRQIAKQQLVDIHRRHLYAQRRTVTREHRLGANFPHESSKQIIDQIAKNQTSPSGQAAKRDLQRRLRIEISKMQESDREILLMRFVERLSLKEISDVLELKVPTAESRLRRALIRLGKRMNDIGESSK